MKTEITPLVGLEYDGTPFVIFDIYGTKDTITIYNNNIFYNHFSLPTVAITNNIYFNSEDEYFFKSIAWDFYIHFDLCVKLFEIGKTILQEPIEKGFKHSIYIEY